MDSSPHPDVIEFRIEPPGGSNEVPVDVLTQALTGFQHLVLLFAVQAEGRAVRQRLRLPEELRSRYLLRCSPPKPGSFVVSARVGDAQADMIPDPRIAEVMGNLQSFTRAAVRSDRDEIINLVADSRLRLKMLNGLATLAPAAGSGYRFSFRNSVGDEIPIEETLPARIKGLLSPPEEEEELHTVTGLLDEISFSEHKLTIIYSPRNRSLDCFYKEEIEPMLFENRRDLIQVTGRVVVDEENHPKKIVDVEAIRELDLSPFVLKEVEETGLKIRFRKPLVIEPRLSESQQLICLEHEPLGIDVFAPTRAEVFEELKEQLIMLWREYAEEEDAALSEPAQKLKAVLLREWEAVHA